MNDILPAESAQWRELERTLEAVLLSYAYEEIRMPIVEQTAVFKRSIGDTTDIVQKEMYSFDDRNGDSLTLRPEGTASCVRAVLQRGLLQQTPQRLWYAGPMFRHERPQRGRQRQFHQIGIEVFGAEGPDIDAEIILLTARMWRALGLSDVRLELNSLGQPEARERYRGVLQEYLRDHHAALDDDSRNRLDHNPLRILDSKNPELSDIISAAPVLTDYLDSESAEHFACVQEMLAANGVTAVLNPRLVRGLDYYSRTVFEWITTSLGAQGTICAGGRYDGLVALMGGKPTPAVGCAMGLERLLELQQEQNSQAASDAPDVYLMAMQAELDPAMLGVAERLRNACPSVIARLHVGGGSVKSRMKKAGKSGAQLALLLGEDEHNNGTITVKHLRSDKPQITLAEAALERELSALLAE